MWLESTRVMRIIVSYLKKYNATNEVFECRGCYELISLLLSKNILSIRYIALSSGSTQLP